MKEPLVHSDSGLSGSPHPEGEEVTQPSRGLGSSSDFTIKTGDFRSGSLCFSKKPCHGGG